jgi:hypothetical protein
MMTIMTNALELEQIKKFEYYLYCVEKRGRM